MPCMREKQTRFTNKAVILEIKEEGAFQSFIWIASWERFYEQWGEACLLGRKSGGCKTALSYLICKLSKWILRCICQTRPPAPRSWILSVVQCSTMCNGDLSTWRAILSAGMKLRIDLTWTPLPQPRKGIVPPDLTQRSEDCTDAHRTRAFWGL